MHLQSSAMAYMITRCIQRDRNTQQTGTRFASCFHARGHYRSRLTEAAPAMPSISEPKSPFQLIVLAAASHIGGNILPEPHALMGCSHLKSRGASVLVAQLCSGASVSVNLCQLNAQCPRSQHHVHMHTCNYASLCCGLYRCSG